MRFGAPARILASAVVLTAALAGLVVRENIARDQGQEVRLALAGYDPRSLLQGHYVPFQLQDTLAGATTCPPGSNAGLGKADGWVALRADGAVHRVAGAARTRPAALKMGAVAVRGGVGCFGSRSTTVIRDGRSEVTEESVTVNLNLGVDRIHLDQKAAEALQADLRRAPPGGGPPGYAVLSVGRDGKARVKGLIVGNRRVDLGWF